MEIKLFGVKLTSFEGEMMSERAISRFMLRNAYRSASWSLA